MTREYEIKEKTGTAGPGLLWVIYSAVKKSNGQQASVWVLTRLALEKYDKQVIIFLDMQHAHQSDIHFIIIRLITQGTVDDNYGPDRLAGPKALDPNFCKKKKQPFDCTTFVLKS